MPQRILIVDDTRTVRMFEAMMLQGLGFELAEAVDGEDALARVRAWRPDLVLMDIVMPKLDGVEACRRLKADPATRDIPVVIITTKGDPKMAAAAATAGCDGFLTKPVDRSLLLAEVRNHLGAAGGHRVAAGRVTAPAAKAGAL